MMPIYDANNQFDRNFFKLYGEMQAEAAALSGIDAKLSASRERLTQAQKEEATAATRVAVNTKGIAHHKGKIAKVEEQWTVFHPDTWFSGGVYGRLNRQNDKLDKLSADAPGLDEKLKQLRSREIPQLRELITQQSNALARKQAKEASALGAFDACVQAFKTPALAHLEQQTAQWHATTQFEETNVGILKQVATLMASARGHYTQARSNLQQASSTNQSAQMVNTVGTVAQRGRGVPRRRGVGAGLGAGGGAGGAVQVMQQSQRDRMMRDAQMHVDRGASEIQQAFSAVPAAARQRYPQLCTTLGQVHMPDFRQAGFGNLAMQLMGGGIGNAISNATVARKIQHNLSLLSQCEQLIAAQEAMVVALLGAIARDSEQAKSALAQVDAQKKSQKQQIFDSVASRVLSGMPAAAPVAMPVAMPAPAMAVQATPTQAQAVAEPAAAAAVAQPAETTRGGPDPTEQLLKLKSLLDAGVLTQAEFDEKKVVLMGKI